MALIACPDCGRQISDAAPLCIGCGRPMGGATPMAAPDIASSVQRSGYACPKCGGDLVSYRALHEADAAGAPPYAAPPDRDALAPMSMTGCTLALVAGSALGAAIWYYYGWLWGILAFFISIKLFGRLARAQAAPRLDAEHRAAMERWERRHVCSRCGAHVVREPDGTMTVEDADAEIDALIRAGQKIQAIKLVRERTSLGLKEAKELVDAREKEL